ncbi:glycosyltransferase [Parabacteroides sp. OttesenSCG-928-G07]|nr:glycosyltransferase [Parabacteroides sp. OttesenSCG-928-G07]
MKELLIISNEQFGYHTDSFKYCQNLKDTYTITYFCFYKGQPKISLDGVENIYIPWDRSKIVRSVAFFFKALKAMFFCKGVTFIVYFNGFTLLHLLLPWKKAILDIRTLSVSPNKTKRYLEDLFLKVTAKTFSYVTVVSQGVKEKLNLSSKKTFILPLGADCISEKRKDYKKVHLLYVGTLMGRKILDTVKGFHKYILFNKDAEITYDIVGDGSEKEEIKRYIEQNKLTGQIVMHGYLPHQQLQPLFDRCNIGVSYVPITEYYTNQPATKTFEYAMSGLYVVATNTKSNREVITPDNGILIEDSVNSFYEAMKQISLTSHCFNEAAIRSSLSQYSWNSVINTYLLPVLKAIEKTKV